MKLYRNHINQEIEFIKKTEFHIEVGDVRHLDNMARRNIHLHKPKVRWIKKLITLNHETAMNKYKNLASNRKRREKRQQEDMEKSTSITHIIKIKTLMRSVLENYRTRKSQLAHKYFHKWNRFCGYYFHWSGGKDCHHSWNYDCGCEDGREWVRSRIL